MQYHTNWGSVPSSSGRHFLFPTFHSTWSPPCTCTACSPCRTPCWSPSPGTHHGCNELRINSKELESTWCSCGRRPQDPRQWFLPWILLPWPRTHPLSQLCLKRKDVNTDWYITEITLRTGTQSRDALGSSCTSAFTIQLEVPTTSLLLQLPGIIKKTWLRFPPVLLVRVEHKSCCQSSCPNSNCSSCQRSFGSSLWRILIDYSETVSYRTASWSSWGVLVDVVSSRLISLVLHTILSWIRRPPLAPPSISPAASGWRYWCWVEKWARGTPRSWAERRGARARAVRWTRVVRWAVAGARTVRTGATGAVRASTRRRARASSNGSSSRRSARAAWYPTWGSSTTVPPTTPRHLPR